MDRILLLAGGKVHDYINRIRVLLTFVPQSEIKYVCGLKDGFLIFKLSHKKHRLHSNGTTDLSWLKSEHLNIQFLYLCFGR